MRYILDGLAAQQLFCHKWDLFVGDCDVRLLDAAREAVYKWWRTDNVPANEQGRRLMGKPSVRFRKVVNTIADDGGAVAVNAQQYCVLVMDVPNVDNILRRSVHALTSVPLSSCGSSCSAC